MVLFNAVVFDWLIKEAKDVVLVWLKLVLKAVEFVMFRKEVKDVVLLWFMEGAKSVLFVWLIDGARSVVFGWVTFVLSAVVLVTELAKDAVGLMGTADASVDVDPLCDAEPNMDESMLLPDPDLDSDETPK